MESDQVFGRSILLDISRIDGFPVAQNRIEIARKTFWTVDPGCRSWVDLCALLDCPGSVWSPRTGAPDSEFKTYQAYHRHKCSILGSGGSEATIKRRKSCLSVRFMTILLRYKSFKPHYPRWIVGRHRSHRRKNGSPQKRANLRSFVVQE